MNEGTQSPKTSYVDGDSSSEIISSRGGSRERSEALEKVTNSLTMRQSASGPAAMIAAIAQLPEGIQLKQLEIEEERIKQQFALEKHQIDVLARDRDQDRELQKIKLHDHQKREQKTEVLTFAYVVGISIAVIAIVALLIANEQYAIAINVLTSTLALGAGWVGGKGSGLAKAQREQSKSTDAQQ